MATQRSLSDELSALSNQVDTLDLGKYITVLQLVLDNLSDIAPPSREAAQANVEIGRIAMILIELLTAVNDLAASDSEPTRTHTKSAQSDPKRKANT